MEWMDFRLLAVNLMRLPKNWHHHIRWTDARLVGSLYRCPPALHFFGSVCSAPLAICLRLLSLAMKLGNGENKEAYKILVPEIMKASASSPSQTKASRPSGRSNANLNTRKIGALVPDRPRIAKNPGTIKGGVWLTSTLAANVFKSFSPKNIFPGPTYTEWSWLHT